MADHLIVSLHPESIESKLIIASITIWGIAVQNLAYAVIIPLFLFLHLSTSPTVFSTAAADYAVNVFDTFSIPITMVLAYALPTVLMSLPAPSILDFSTKQNFVAFWQFFPLWISMLQSVIVFLMCSVSNGNIAGRDPVPTPKASMKNLRSLYILLIVVAAANQFSTLSVIAISKFFPGIFAPEHVGVMTFSRVFLPQAITASTKMPSIGEGALMLVQYDECIGSLSMALWAAVLLVQAYDTQRRSTNYATLAFYGVIAVVLTGPLGFAVACIWARDELVHGTDIELERKSQ